MEQKIMETIKRKKTDTSMIYGKVPPQATEIEKAVLGTILMQPEAIHQVNGLLHPEMFYKDAHQKIYTAMLSMGDIDMLLLIEKLKASEDLDNVGGPYYISTLTNHIVSLSNLERQVRVLAEKYLLREQIRIRAEMVSLAYEDDTDPFENMEGAEKSLHDLAGMIVTGEAEKIDTVSITVFQKIDELRVRETYLTGVTSGFKSIDKVTMGWQDSDLIIIAARPSVGKTAFTLALATNSAAAGTPTAFFSLEMSKDQLAQRVLASTSKMFLSTIKGARLDDMQMQHLYANGVQKVAKLPLYVDDTATLTVAMLKSRLRRLVRKHGVKLACVDYLQLIKSSVSKNASRQQQVGDISRELKIVAKELHIPIIVLSQLNRAGDGESPKLSHLREAGDIEQDADAVLLIYGHSEEKIKADAALDGEVFVKIAKHRNGSLAHLKFNYNKSIQVFTEEGAAPELQGRFVKVNTEENPF